MLQRGVTVAYGTVRRWCLKFGQGRKAQGAERIEQFGGGKHLSGNQTGQHGGVESVFVFVVLRPRRRNVRQT
ncbi:hypothetical protein ACGFWI_37150 [Streptomyces sp. NPDC048434]|uniref:hypothetical protein n=1 Tax=Streptomyces sp. NPDC048434 TaxID=3365549 RepID=UPI003719AA3E